MNISKIDVCNLALANLGQPSIQSWDDPNERARKCKLFYPVALAETLRAHPWKFAETVEPLAQVDVTLAGWRYCYKYPVTAANVQTVRVGRECVPFQVTSLPQVGRVIVCDAPKAHCVYTRLEEDPSQWDDGFVRVMAWTLASDLALPLTQDTALMQNAARQREGELDRAKYTNREEGETVVRYHCSYLPGRKNGKSNL